VIDAETERQAVPLAEELLRIHIGM
jgi:hypothetical protein